MSVPCLQPPRLVEEPLVVHQVSVGRLSLSQCYLLADVSLPLPDLLLLLGPDILHPLLPLELFGSELPDLLSFLDLLLVLIIIIVLNSVLLLPSPHCCLSQRLLLLQILIVCHTLLHPGSLFQLQFRLPLCDVQGVDAISEALVNSVLLQIPPIGSQSHVDGDCVSPQILPVRDARGNLPILLILGCYLLRWGSQNLRGRRALASRNLSVLECWG